mgnify:CR=1 FL=1
MKFTLNKVKRIIQTLESQISNDNAILIEQLEKIQKINVKVK